MMAAPRRPRTYKPPETVNMTLRLPPQMDERIVEEAQRRGIAKHAMILQLLDAGLAALTQRQAPQ